MSTSTISADTGTSTSSPSSHSADADTATLYLFTFLATILILVLLSASLVLRSYILRRRYRQRFQQALADGLFADLDGRPRSVRRLGPKPALWDIWTCPADKGSAWSSITPVAGRSLPWPSPPSSMVSVSSTPPPPPFFSQLRIPGPFSLSPRQGSSPMLSGTRSPSMRSPDPSTRTDKSAATLTVCVLVAMPDPSSPAHRPGSDAKGKGVPPPGSPAHHQTSDAAPLLPSSLRQPGARICDGAVEDERLPLLEFGVVEVTTGDWVWRT